MATARRLMVLDSATLYYRAFYALPTSMTGPDGRPNNALRGFFDGLAGLVTRLRPTHLVCAWDADWRPEFRVQLWPAYKRHRLAEVSEAASDDELIEEVPDELGPQVDTLAELLDGLGISRVGVAGFEADDVIASVCARSDMPVDIVTSDRDLLQCVDDSRSVRLISIARGLRDPQVLDESAVLERYGVLPQQYVDFATLRGDPSDGLPGVPGVGEKTAAALIREFGGLTRLVDALAQPAGVAGTTPTALKPAVRSRIAAVIETLDPMARVTTAVTDVPLPARWTEAAVLPAAPRREGLAGCESAGVTRQLGALAAAGVVAR